MWNKAVCMVVGHRWKRVNTEDGVSHYRRCRRCAVIRDGPEADPRFVGLMG